MAGLGGSISDAVFGLPLTPISGGKTKPKCLTNRCKIQCCFRVAFFVDLALDFDECIIGLAVFPNSFRDRCWMSAVSNFTSKSYQNPKENLTQKRTEKCVYVLEDFVSKKDSHITLTIYKNSCLARDPPLGGSAALVLEV